MSNNFSMYQGETICMSFTATDPSGNAINLTSGTLYWSYGLNSFGPRYVTKTIDNSGITIVNNLNGTFLINFLPIDTSGKYGPHFYATKFIDYLGNVSILSEGIVNIGSSII